MIRSEPFSRETLDVDLVAVDNVAPAESDLVSYTLPANTLGENNDFVKLVAFGSFATNGNNKRVRAYLGATALFDSGAFAFSNESWRLECIIYRTGAATQKAITSFHASSSLFAPIVNYVTAAEDFTTNLDIKCTGEAASNADITQEGHKVTRNP